jgi:hypothetical protein
MFGEGEFEVKWGDGRRRGKRQNAPSSFGDMQANLSSRRFEFAALSETRAQPNRLGAASDALSHEVPTSPRGSAPGRGAGLILDGVAGASLIRRRS